MSKKTYQTLVAELDTLLQHLQHPDIEVDEAVVLYEQGLKLVAELEKQLKTAENKVRVLQVKAQGTE